MTYYLCPYDGRPLFLSGSGSGTTAGTAIMDMHTGYCSWCGRAFAV